MIILGMGVLFLLLYLPFASTTSGEADEAEARSRPCSGAPYDLAKRFVGRWKEYVVTPDGEELLGTLVSGFALDGCVFSQKFTSVDGSFSFMSFGYVEPDRQMWHETFVFNSGRVAAYRWREEGEDVVIERIDGNPDDLRRLRVKDLTAMAYDVAEERSLDQGKTWEVVELVRTRREAED